MVKVVDKKYAYLCHPIIRFSLFPFIWWEKLYVGSTYDKKVEKRKRKNFLIILKSRSEIGSFIQLYAFLFFLFFHFSFSIGFYFTFSMKFLLISESRTLNLHAWKIVWEFFQSVYFLMLIFWGRFLWTLSIFIDKSAIYLSNSRRSFQVVAMPKFID